MRFLGEDSEYHAANLSSSLQYPVWYPPKSLSSEDGSIDSEDNE
jgi:hypothetical protein